ncbi:hypothetical protein EIP75_22830 [Aquabacterium soli]|jgi:hypothetical protein|uniref:Uncharacterized protein n=1 Tax=Aquabacterium soli TaxID=2493092 RepID=A0A3R8YJM2_9BURK|nr:hypothetical protein [Aquabacterium soli]RRS00951.1 hypothetical protein EIP75_22830 [Aquabacterium soli]
MPSRHVDANYRFIAASNELNARIAQRQQALSLYITLLLGLLAALVAFRPEAGQRVPVEWLVLGFPVASLCLVFLNYKAERALTNLRHFLATLESIDNADGSLPGYNTDARWAQGANRARRFHDYTGAMLVAAGNAVALGALLRIYPQQASLDAPVVWITVVVAVGCVVALLWTSRLSYRPAA